MKSPFLLASAAAFCLAACSGEPDPQQDAAAPAAPEAPAPTVPPLDTMTPAPSPGEQGGVADWRAVAASDDTGRLSRLDQAWTASLEEVRASGEGGQLSALGVLADPNAAMAGRPMPSPGAYRCRTIKLGRAIAESPLAYLAYPYFPCTVELTPGGDLILARNGGSQRFRGLIYPDSERRTVFLGAQAWGDEAGFPAYGAMPERNVIGVVERIGENRWRLVMPWPRLESQLNLIDIAS